MRGRRARQPPWFWAVPVVSLAAAAAGWLRMQRRWRGERRQVLVALGRCGHCEYDLTGNTSGACPECGLRIGPASTRGGAESRPAL